MRSALVLCAVALAGCGSAASDERPASTPDMSKYGSQREVEGLKTPPGPVIKPRISSAVDAQLSGGAVGVEGVGGLVGVRPKTLDTSSDGALSELTWSSWTDSAAVGRGTFSVNDCQPDCADGHPKKVGATVRLSGVTTCDGRRYFGQAEVTLEQGEPPASYVRAPC